MQTGVPLCSGGSSSLTFSESIQKLRNASRKYSSRRIRMDEYESVKSLQRECQVPR